MCDGEHVELSWEDLLTTEEALSDEWNALNPAGDLPTRALTSCVVFQDLQPGLALRDLQCLDVDDPPAIEVVGRLARLNEERVPFANDDSPGPLLRLTDVSEWSVEYDELSAVVWVSTDKADYKLLSACDDYSKLWGVLQRKVALAARSIALLYENPQLTYKQLVRHVVGLNALPGSLQLHAEEMVEFGSFVADQLSNTDRLVSCRALTALRQLIERPTSTHGAKMDISLSEEAESAAPREGEPPKRARRAPTSFAIEGAVHRGARGKREKKVAEKVQRQKSDANQPEVPKAAQTAFAYFSKHVRAEMEGSRLSFGELARLISERWKSASSEEREGFEELAAADRERNLLELEQYKLELEAMKLKSRKRPGPPGQAAQLPGEEDASKRHREADVSGAAGEVQRESEPRPKGPEKAPTLRFPMEDSILLHREEAHRKMLVASGRSKPVDASAAAAYVYPPQGPYPHVLPPMPQLPSTRPLAPSGDLPAEHVTSLLSVWDFCNSFGASFQLAPGGMPFQALVNAIVCRGPVDLSLASQLHCAMLRVLSRDFEGLEGWDPWLKAVSDPLLVLTWPEVLLQLLRYYVEFEPDDDMVEGLDEIDATLAVGEWTELQPGARVCLLGWLTNRVAQCETVRRYLDRRAEQAAELKTEYRVLLADEEALAFELNEARARLDAACAKAQAAAERGSSTSISAAAVRAAQVAEEERVKCGECDSNLATLRRKRLDCEQMLDSVMVRSDAFGTDRLHRRYYQLGGRHGAGELLLQREDGWERLIGRNEIELLVQSLHPKAQREGALLRALQQRRIRLGAENEGGDLRDPAPDSDRLAKHGGKGLPELYQLGCAQTSGAASGAFAAALRADSAPARTSGRRVSLESEAPGCRAPHNGTNGTSTLQSVLPDRLRKLCAAVEAEAARRSAHPTCYAPLVPADAASTASTSAAATIREMTTAKHLCKLQPAPSCALAHLEHLRFATLELEERLHRVAQVWRELPQLQQMWQNIVKHAVHPLEFAAALLLLDANTSPAFRIRAWGQERSARWRAGVAQGATVAAAASLLLEFDDACAWDVAERQLGCPDLGKKGSSAKPRNGTASRFRRRLAAEDFARLMGETLPLLRWCQDSPHPQSLRGRAGGQLLSFVPHDDGLWSWSSLGTIGNNEVDLKGYSAREVVGQRLTVWYEEEQEDEVRDVPYVGVVLSVSGREGLTVRFDYTRLADGAPEVLVIGDDDDWRWGLHRSKPGQPARRPAAPSTV